MPVTGRITGISSMATRLLLAELVDDFCRQRDCDVAIVLCSAHNRPVILQKPDGSPDRVPRHAEFDRQIPLRRHSAFFNPLS